MIKLEHVYEMQKYCHGCCEIKTLTRRRKFCSRECEKNSVNEANRLGARLYDQQILEKILVKVNKKFSKTNQKQEEVNV